MPLPKVPMHMPDLSPTGRTSHRPRGGHRRARRGITLALFGGSGSSGSGGGPPKDRSIDPVEPHQPQRQGRQEALNDRDPLADVGDPFASSFGSQGLAQGDGPRFRQRDGPASPLRYRDGHKSGQVANGDVLRGLAPSRAVLPHAAVGIQIAGKTTRGTCTILVDGVKVASKTVRKAWGVTFCVG